jgi:hypothetical protein
MKITLYAIALGICLLYSCQKKKETPVAIVKIDSSFVIDSTVYAKLANDSTLQLVDKMAFQKLNVGIQADTNFTEVAQSFADFLKIDSLKTAKAFQKYTDSLDLGGLANAEAKILDTLQLSANTSMVRWAILGNSYAACPWYTYNMIYGSILSNNMVSKTYVLGFDQQFGDPPYGYQQSVETNYQKGTLSYKKTEVSIDYDEANERKNVKAYAWTKAIK